MKHLLLLVILISSVQLIQAQDFAVFQNSSELITENEFGGPICKGFTDINGDFRDDIIRIANATKVVVDIQSNEGEFFQSFVIDTLEGDSWTIAVADVDNNGFSDIMSAGNYNGLRIYETGPDPTTYEKMFESELQFFAQGSNFVDIDNDGWLDMFICDDDGVSEIFLNDQNGGFVHDTSYINMVSAIPSDNSGNYGSEWTDIDGDNDLDLYIAKCRLGIEEETDPRRINTLFINDNGTYREAAAQYNLAIGAQSWTANFGDIDNDGDQDVFVMNHEFRSQLFENIDNQTFTEIPLLNDGREIKTEGYQSAMADFNNDGFLDILIVGGGDRLLLNDQNKSFKEVSSPIGGNQTFSFALGDANEDGFIDIFSSYRSLGSGLNGDRDRLWTSMPNGNNYVAFSLVGEESNRSGVGAIVRIYGEWGVQTRIIKAGEGYGVTNSLTARFGLDEATDIESMVVTWPSGTETSYDNVSFNKHYIVHEGDCIEELAKVTTTATRLDCETGQVTLSTTDGTSGNWSNGTTGASTIIDQPGMYYVEIGGGSQCSNYGQAIIVRGAEVLETPKINIANDILICNNNAVELSVRGLNADDLIDWSNGEEALSITIEETGNYFAVNQNNCDTIPSNSINVEFVDPQNITTEYGLEFEDKDTDLQLAVGENEIVWYSDVDGTDQIFTGDDFQTGPLESDTTFYFDYTVNQKAPIYVGGPDIELSVDDPDFSFPSVVGSLFFVVRDSSILRSFDVNSDYEGLRKFTIHDVVNGSQVVHEKTINVGLGVETVELDIVMSPGSYEIRIDQEFNLEEHDQKNPGFGILTGDLKYPYNIGDVGTISRSSFGRNFYHYFYNWNMEIVIEECRTDIQEYVITYNPIMSSTETLASVGLNIYPNPTENIITLEGNDGKVSIMIYNKLNQLVKRTESRNTKTSIDMTGLEQGHYIMTIQSDDYTVSQKLIKL